MSEDEWINLLEALSYETTKSIILELLSTSEGSNEWIELLENLEIDTIKSMMLELLEENSNLKKEIEKLKLKVPAVQK